MCNKNLIGFFLNIYLVSCSPIEARKEVTAVNPSDQIAQDSNISGVSV